VKDKGKMKETADWEKCDKYLILYN